MESLFCSLCNQVVVNPPMASHVLSRDHFAKVRKVRLVRKIFSVAFEIFMLKRKRKNLKVHEIFSKMLKIKVTVIDLIIFAMYVKYSFLKGKLMDSF